MNEVIEVWYDSENKDFCDCLVDGVAKADGSKLSYGF